MDVGGTAWESAVREMAEEISGITADQADVVGEYLWECPERCGWSYRTFAVRVPLHRSGSLPRVCVARGHSAWETSGLAWVPTDRVHEHDDLHPGLRAAWPTLSEAITV
jgi:8-oxo-dGTP pyrophosphatase MutT (NUDIX family)